MNTLKKTVLICCIVVPIIIYLSERRPPLIAGKYRVEAIGEPGRCLYFDTGKGGRGRVEATVVAVGWDDQHVIVKQEREKNFFYYIIEHTKDNSLLNIEEIVVGPLSQPDFEGKRGQMGVSSNLNFTTTYRWFSDFQLIGW